MSPLSFVTNEQDQEWQTKETSERLKQQFEATEEEMKWSEYLGAGQS